MFARANAQKIKRLLDEPIAYFGVLAQAPRQNLIARTHPASLFANQQTSGQPRLAPRGIQFRTGLFHCNEHNWSAERLQNLPETKQSGRGVPPLHSARTAAGQPAQRAALMLFCSLCHFYQTFLTDPSSGFCRWRCKEILDKKSKFAKYPVV